MANEYKVTCGFTCDKGGMRITPKGNFNITMAGANMMDATQDVGTSAEALDLGPIAGVPPVIYIENLDSTNFVLIGWTNPPTEMKLLAGQATVFPTSTATMYVKADTAAVRIRVGTGEP